ncbi:MAG: LamG-like jellyroll fold domain-containing protein, partial [Sphaerospermopsis kisseleviana]
MSNNLIFNQSVLSFDGKDDYVALPAANNDYSQGFTVEAWVQYSSFQQSWSRIIDFGNGQGQNNIVLGHVGTSNNLGFHLYSSAGTDIIEIPNALEIGKWTHIVVTIDKSGEAKLYQNGQLVQTKPFHLPDNIDRKLNYIAKSNWSNDGYFEGQITEVRLWNIARTPEEIQQNMNSRLRGNESGLVGYYPLNGDANDKTSNANHGTINGAIWQQEEIPVADLTGGNELKSRGVCDTRTNFYLVDTNNPININGDINGWEIWADTTAPLQLIIYRKDGSSWSVVGKSDMKTPVVGLNQFSLSTPMTVKQGDFVGIYYPGGGSVSFNLTTDKEASDLGNLTSKVLFTNTGAGATAFSGSSNRVYSIRVKGVAQVIQPTSEKTIPGVIGIGMNNQLYTRKTLTSNWEHIPNSGSVLGITVMPDGTIVGIGMNNQLYIRKTLTSNWEHIPNSGSVLGIVCYSGVALAPKSQPEVKPEVKADTTAVLKSLGRIVVNADEWTISDAGIKTTPDAATFALNIAKYFVGENKGKFHVLSNNFGLTGASLEQTMTKAGHTWTKGMNIPINLETLEKYDGIFIGGDLVNNQVLIEYVKNGGKVYL